MKAALLVVDMSVEQVASIPAARTQTIVATIQQLTASPSQHWALKLDSRLWLVDNQESTLSRVYPEWGVSMGVPGSEGADLIPELRNCGLQFIEKKHYSSFVDSPLLDMLRKHEITDLFITGINTDYCIFNTAMDSFARGKFRTHVVEEGVWSVSGTAGHRQGLSWTRAHLGADAVVSLEELKRG